MNNTNKFIKKYWKDPVWSKVIAAGIISLLTFIIGVFYTLFQLIYNQIPFIEISQKLIIILTHDFKISIWLGLLLVFTFLTLTFKQITYLFRGIYYKLRNFKIKTTGSNIKEELPLPLGYSTKVFSERMSKVFPGTLDIKWFTKSKEATDRLELLLKKPLQFKTGYKDAESDPFWWFRGGDAMHIFNSKRIGRRKILMDYKQLKIKKIASYHGYSYYKDFVYVEVKAEKQTGLYKITKEHIKQWINKNGYYSEEYALIKYLYFWKKAISRQDFDDGATVIRGKVKNTPDAELRERFLSDYNFIITAKGSPYNSSKFCHQSKEYFDGLLTGEVEYDDFFEFLKGFNKNEN